MMLQKVEPTGKNPDNLPSEMVEGPVVDHHPRRRISVWPFFRGIIQTILVVGLLFGAQQVASRMIASKPATQKRPVFKKVYTIQTAQAVARDNQPLITAYGQTVAARTVDLRALVSGEIVSVSDQLRVGAKVEKGATLLEIDAFNYKGALQEAKANLAEAEAKVAENMARIESEKTKRNSAREQLDFAKSDLERADRLRKRGQLTQQQLESRKLVVSQRQQTVNLSADTIAIEDARIQQMEAQKDRLRWRVDQAERNLESTTLKAPFTGIIRSSTAEVGRLVNANDAVVSMYDEGSMDVRFTLTDAQYGRLQTASVGLVGRPITITWTIGGKKWQWPGAIDRVGAEITSSRGGVEIFARIGSSDNPVLLRPGAFVELQVPDQIHRNSFALPDTALHGNDTVYVAVNGKLEERRIEVLAFQSDSIIVGGGLKDGDDVLTTRITEVSAGLLVRKEGDVSPSGSENISIADPAGRPTREEMAKILEANKLTFPDFRALPGEEKRKLIADWRKKNGGN